MTTARLSAVYAAWRVVTSDFVAPKAELWTAARTPPLVARTSPPLPALRKNCPRFCGVPGTSVILPPWRAGVGRSRWIRHTPPDRISARRGTALASPRRRLGRHETSAHPTSRRTRAEAERAAWRNDPGRGRGA